MFSFLNTLDILPVKQVDFIAQLLRDSGLDAAVMLKAKVGMTGFVSLNAWMANADPLCRTIATEVVCCAASQPELRRILEEFCAQVQTLSKRRSDEPDGSELLAAALDPDGLLGSFQLPGAHGPRGKADTFPYSAPKRSGGVIDDVA